MSPGINKKYGKSFSDVGLTFLKMAETRQSESCT
jgi:hypothetical protein